jgi:ankyrin repeat protein
MESDAGMELMGAFQERDFEKFESLIADGADIHVHYDESSFTMLMLAVLSGLPQYALALLNAGAMIDAKDEEGRTVLHYAALANPRLGAGVVEIVKMLLDFGASDMIDDRCEDGRTALAIAVGKCVPLVKVLLQAGADPNIPGRQGVTALMSCCYRFDFQPELLQRLLDAGADVHATDERGTTVMDVAVQSETVEMVEMLVAAGADVNAGAVLPLSAASAFEDTVVLQALLTAGADVNAKDSQGHTPLFAAIAHGNAAAVEALLGAGADPMAVGAEGKSPLEAAEGTEEVMEVLLRYLNK